MLSFEAENTISCEIFKKIINILCLPVDKTLPVYYNKCTRFRGAFLLCQPPLGV